MVVGEAGSESTRATLVDSATHTADSTAALRPSTSRRKSSGVRPGSGRPPESVTRTSRTTREVSTPGSR